MKINQKKKHTQVSKGKKFDTGKLRWDLVPFKAMSYIVAVITFGAMKYDANNWQLLADAEGRYFAACIRHLSAYKEGEWLDPESKLPHLAHAGCNILFLLWFGDRKHVKKHRSL